MPAKNFEEFKARCTEIIEPTVYISEDDARDSYISAIMAIGILSLVAMSSMGYYIVHRFNDAKAQPSCVVSKSEAMEVLHIAQVKPEKRHVSK